MDSLEAEVVAATAKVGVEGLRGTSCLKGEALDPYRAQDVSGAEGPKVPGLEKVTDADAVERRDRNKAGGELEMLIDIVGNLKIEDATQTTQIIDGISTIYADAQCRSKSRSRTAASELARSRGRGAVRRAGQTARARRWSTTSTSARRRRSARST